MKKKLDILMNVKVIVPNWYCLKYETLYVKVEPDIKVVNQIRIDKIV
jgi:hypothetical protein